MYLTIHPLTTSQMAMEAGRLTYLRGYGKRKWVPCSFFAITGGREPVLVDTGGQAEDLSALRLEPVKEGLDFGEALGRVGLAPEDITTVIQTHLMYDHCANSRKLPRAKFFVQKKELDFAQNPHPLLAGAYQPQLFEGLPFQTVEGDVALMEGIELLFTPGHTPGNQSVAVTTKFGRAVIAGFCCTLENFFPQESPAWVTSRVPEVIPPGIHTDMVQAYESMLRVKGLADILIPPHDPQMAKKKKIPDS